MVKKHFHTYQKKIKLRKEKDADLSLDSLGFDSKEFHRLKDLYKDIYLERSNYVIRSSGKQNELANGYCSNAFRYNPNEMFYLAPTISPVEYLDKPDYDANKYLEHPLACFEYYQSKGITQLVGEHKYMGSRAHILIFKSLDHAMNMGFNRPISVISRNGYKFFEASSPYYDIIYDDIKDKLEHDFMILDCEILPWSLKAESMIKFDFLRPGECTYLARKYAGEDYSSAEKFVKEVNKYGSETDIEVFPFHVLAYGSIKADRNGKTVFSDYVNGYEMNHLDHASMIYKIQGDVFRKLDFHMVDTLNSDSVKSSIDKWSEYCDVNNGEGFVYKPMTFKSFLPSGYPVQSAIKVRGREYLRIVYGIDYLDTAYFTRLTKRGIRRKRKMAIQESELAEKILLSFLHMNKVQLMRHISGMIGMENCSFSGIDKTL